MQRSEGGLQRLEPSATAVRMEVPAFYLYNLTFDLCNCFS